MCVCVCMAVKRCISMREKGGVYRYACMYVYM
jgi:hypothetical protein